MKFFALLSLAAASVLASHAEAATRTRHSVSTYNSEDSYSHTRSSSDANMVGFQFGPQIASGSLSTNNGAAPDSDSRTRINMGVFFEHAFDSNFVLRPELNFSERGFSMNGQNGSADFSANYLEVPAMVKGQLPLGGFTPYVMTGPFVGFLVGKGVTVNTKNGQQSSVNLNNQVNSFNFGWNFGLGSSFAVARGWKLDAGLRYSLGLTNVSSTSADGDSVKLSAFQVLAGISTAI
jgi:opacity protein-like surface antigen